MTDAASTPAVERPGYRFYVLAVLIFVYMLNFLDRQIIGILAAPLKAEFGLSDSQFGLLGGIAFASVYSTLAIPLAWLADRFSRVWIMTGALAVWSGFTALCGAAGGFGQLFLCRMGVGVGEAGGVAPAYSLIADYFPPRQRARALAAFAFGIPLGTAAGTLVGGLLAANYGWRTSFIVVGLIGLLFAPLLRLTVRDPKRGGTDAVKTEAQVAALAAAPAGSDRVGKIAAQIMLGVGGGALALAALIRFAGLALGNPLVFAFGGLLAGVIGVIYLASIAHVLLVYGGLLGLLGRLNPLRFFQGIAPALAVAFSTSSSSGTLPVSIECARKNLGVSEGVAGFVLPVGATINMDGTAIYQGVLALFIAQAFGIDLSAGQYAMIILTATLASIGTAGIPGAGLIMLGLVLTAAGLPLEGVALIAGIDRILDMARTTVNVAGDLMTTTLVGRSEQELDRAVYDSSNKE